MKLRHARYLIALSVLLIAIDSSSAQEEPVCVQNSPEGHGDIGCSIIDIKPLPANLQEPVFWHIDRFDDPEQARAGAGPTSTAFDAHGAWWLMSVESGNSGSQDHHGGTHVARVNLSPLPKERPKNTPCW